MSIKRSTISFIVALCALALGTVVTAQALRLNGRPVEANKTIKVEPNKLIVLEAPKGADQVQWVVVEDGLDVYDCQGVMVATGREGVYTIIVVTVTGGKLKLDRVKVEIGKPKPPKPPGPGPPPEPSDDDPWALVAFGKQVGEALPDKKGKLLEAFKAAHSKLKANLGMNVAKQELSKVLGGLSREAKQQINAIVLNPLEEILKELSQEGKVITPGDYAKAFGFIVKGLSS